MNLLLSSEKRSFFYSEDAGSRFFQNNGYNTSDNSGTGNFVSKEKCYTTKPE
jgi:hypothetical protein